MGLLNSYKIEKIHFLWEREMYFLGLELNFSTVIAHFSPRDYLFGEPKHLDDRQQCRKAQKRDLSSQDGW